ncbi:ankyrin repeat domain-containing protein [Candidatus Babela massiliensis]|uniref:Ankyrin repeats containing protein n=1 Tax=Candidatus Babela massiliensis TaxID=673862 RepID=V6DI37_9BACT|nr:ankyrin repeat domain-containing protein [Candidatus Babela massiliensis]CDK30196.1 Ankyrin repeats containing protein [Candidatus Babela massiliensis]
MNKLKHLYILLLLVLFFNNNIISMGQPDYMKVEQESPLLRLPNELIVNIINQVILPQVKEAINNSWNNIFSEPKSIKINLQDDLQGLRCTSVHLYDLINDNFNSPSLKNYLNQLVKDLKQKQFDELFEALKHQSIEQYKGLPKDQLNEALIKILKKPIILVHEEDLKTVVKLILAGGTYVNDKNFYGYTALMKSSRHGYKEIVKILIKVDADINVQNKFGSTALMMASEFDYKEIVELLIESKVDINIKDYDGYTALMLASGNGHKYIVEMLIKAGANVDAKNNDGNTALMIASEKGYKDIVEILKEAESK